MNRVAISVGAFALLGFSGLAAETQSEEYTEWEREVAQSFVDLDADGDRTLSREEAADDPTLESHFSMADTDGDGKLQVEEFAAFEVLIDSLDIQPAPSI